MAARSVVVLLCSLLSVAFFAPAMSDHLAPIDAAVLNFALNLEYLEANFYYCAAYGTPIPQELWASGDGKHAGCAPIGCPHCAHPPCTKLTGDTLAYAIEIAEHELAHVKTLKSVLLAGAVAQPCLDIGKAFNDAAFAAGTLALGADSADAATLGAAFDPYANNLFFLHGAYIFEDVGVSAYSGAAALLEDSAILTAAAKILAVEAYHAGTIRTLLYQERKTAISGTDLEVENVVGAISDLRDALNGGDDRDQNVVNNLASNIVPTDQNGLCFDLNTDQVLGIVYFGGKKMGGFYPKGLNGDIK